jgi:GT2 family glycosyltransferase
VLPRVSAVIVNYNDGVRLLDCVNALRGEPWLVETIVVDNGSTDESRERLLSVHPDATVIVNHDNRGISVARNQGAAIAQGDILLFLDPDAILAPGGVRSLAEALQARPGVAGPVLEESGIRSYGCAVDILGYSRALPHPDQPMYLKGCAFATSRHYWERLGGVDDRFFFAMDEVDYCWRVLLAGGEVSLDPHSLAVHGGGSSTPGGYVNRGRLETSRFRLTLREQNTLAMLLKCAPARWLVWLIPIFVLKSLATATVALGLRQPGVGADILKGLAWNLRQLPETLDRRRGTPRSRATERRATARVDRRFFALEAIRRNGLPRFVDS